MDVFIQLLPDSLDRTVESREGQCRKLPPIGSSVSAIGTSPRRQFSHTAPWFYLIHILSIHMSRLCLPWPSRHSTMAGHRWPSSFLPPPHPRRMSRCKGKGPQRGSCCSLSCLAWCCWRLCADGRSDCQSDCQGDCRGDCQRHPAAANLRLQ